MAVPFGKSSHVPAGRVRKPVRGGIAESTYGVLRKIISEPEWLLFEPLIADIERLKAERNAVILAHNYQTPEIFHGVADFQGDSLALACEAAAGDAEVIVMCGVSFMAETAKLSTPTARSCCPTPKPAARWPSRSDPRTCATCAAGIRACP